eukprot:SAG22_NODE_16528_length_323_cov_0.924107_1_plen_65_part_01
MLLRSTARGGRDERRLGELPESGDRTSTTVTVGVQAMVCCHTQSKTFQVHVMQWLDVGVSIRVRA